MLAIKSRNSQPKIILKKTKYPIPKISFLGPPEVGEKQCMERERKKKERKVKVRVNNSQLHLRTPPCLDQKDMLVFVYAQPMISVSEMWILNNFLWFDCHWFQCSVKKADVTRILDSWSAAYACIIYVYVLDYDLI